MPVVTLLEARALSNAKGFAVDCLRITALVAGRALQELRNVASDDLLSQAFSDGGLAHTRLTNKHLVEVRNVRIAGTLA